MQIANPRGVFHGGVHLVLDKGSIKIPLDPLDRNSQSLPLFPLLLGSRQLIRNNPGTARVAAGVPNVQQVVNDLQVKNQKASSSQ